MDGRVVDREGSCQDGQERVEGRVVDRGAAAAAAAHGSVKYTRLLEKKEM